MTRLGLKGPSAPTFSSAFCKSSGCWVVRSARALLIALVSSIVRRTNTLPSFAPSRGRRCDASAFIRNLTATRAYGSLAPACQDQVIIADALSLLGGDCLLLDIDALDSAR